MRILFLLFGLLSCNLFAQNAASINLKQQKMKIEIWSDVACPFCFIGKRHLEKALENFSEKDNIEIVWKSFQLDPDLNPKEGESLYESLSEKKGWSIAQTKQITQNVIQMAKAIGIEMNFDQVIPANTLKAHQFLQLAKTLGKGNEAKELLLKAYFTQGKNIADVKFLKSIATELGIEEKNLNQIEDNTFYEKVQEDIYESRQIGVQGVPFFLFNEQYAISGAQPVKAFEQTLEKSYAAWKSSQPTISISTIEGKSCTPDEECK